MCSDFAVLPHPATTLFSTSPPPLSSSPSQHSLLLINPTSSSPLHTEPPLSIPSVQRATDELVSLVPSSNGLTVASSSVVASSSLVMYDAKEKLCFFSLDIPLTSNLAGFVPFLTNWYFIIDQLVMMV